MVNFDISLVLLNIKHTTITEFDAQFCVNIQCSSFSSLPSPQSSSWLHSSWLYTQRLFSHRKRNGESQAISTESTEVKSVTLWYFRPLGRKLLYHFILKHLYALYTSKSEEAFRHKKIFSAHFGDYMLGHYTFFN